MRVRVRVSKGVWEVLKWEVEGGREVIQISIVDHALTLTLVLVRVLQSNLSFVGSKDLPYR